MSILRKFQQFIKSSRAATAIEYSLIAALIALVVIVAMRFVGGELNNTFSYINGTIDNAIQ